MPENLRGSHFQEKDIRQTTSLAQNTDNSVEIDAETETVHIGRKSHNECAVITIIGNRNQKALWDSGAGRCVISSDCYNSLHHKCKTEMFPSNIRIKAANGTFIASKGECDITLRISNVTFTIPFLCSHQTSHQMILGHNCSKAYLIGTHWNEDDIMSLTRNGKPFAETLPTNDVNALVFCAESTVIPPHSNGYLKCKIPKVKRKANLGRICVFEPSFGHRSTYSHCNIYEGRVTINDGVVSSGTFNIVMTNRSDSHIKINNNQTMGMLRSCEENQICTIHKIVIFEQKPRKGKDDKSETIPKERNLYYVPTRLPKTVELK